jgi:hypothetical protein
MRLASTPLRLSAAAIDFRRPVSYYLSQAESDTEHIPVRPTAAGRTGCLQLVPLSSPGRRPWVIEETSYHAMPKLSIDEIRRRFETGTAFNAVFDAFQQAVDQRLQDMELYRQLFWNKFLSSDEICLFGQKLAHEFPHMAYDIYFWLASVFAVNYSVRDNYELALNYFEKAATAKPDQPAPYLDAANCYEPDLNIPPLPISSIS